MECWERTKQMGALSLSLALLLCGRPSAESLKHPPPTHPPTSPPPPRLLAQKRGAILRDQNEAGTDNLVWTQHYTAAASPSWGDGYCKCMCMCVYVCVCVSFLRLWNIHCSAQEVAIQIIYAVSNSCRHHKVSWVQDHMMEKRESGGTDGICHGWKNSKCCTQLSVPRLPFKLASIIEWQQPGQLLSFLSQWELKRCKNGILYNPRGDKVLFNSTAHCLRNARQREKHSTTPALSKQRIIQLCSLIPENMIPKMIRVRSR